MTWTICVMREESSSAMERESGSRDEREERRGRRWMSKKVMSDLVKREREGKRKSERKREGKRKNERERKREKER